MKDTALRSPSIAIHIYSQATIGPAALSDEGMRKNSDVLAVCTRTGAIDTLNYALQPSFKRRKLFATQQHSHGDE